MKSLVILFFDLVQRISPQSKNITRTFDMAVSDNNNGLNRHSSLFFFEISPQK